MRLDQGRKQRSGAQHITHRVELDDQDMLFDPLVMVTRTEDARGFVPQTRPISYKESTIECILTGHTVGPQD
jgi:hypothetical protein